MWDMRVVGICLAFVVFSENALASRRACERVGIVNHQEIPLETMSGSKGEGLRSYLEKDKEALHYFNLYQERNQIQPFNTVLGIVGPGLLLTGVILESGVKEKETFLTWGAVLVVTNFLVTRTIQGVGETYLEKAVEEYNKRNFPKIDLNFHTPDSSQKNIALMIKKDWSF